MVTSYSHAHAPTLTFCGISMIKGRAAYFLDVNEQDVVKVHLNYVMVVCYLGAMEQYSWIK